MKYRPGLPCIRIVTGCLVKPAFRSPVPIIRRANEAMVRLLTRADIKERFFNAGVEVVGNTPEQFTAEIKSEMSRLGKVIKDAGIRAD